MERKLTQTQRDWFRQWLRFWEKRGKPSECAFDSNLDDVASHLQYATEPGAPLSEDERKNIARSAPWVGGCQYLYDAWKTIDAELAKRNVPKQALPAHDVTPLEWSVAERMSGSKDCPVVAEPEPELTPEEKVIAIMNRHEHLFTSRQDVAAEIIAALKQS